MVLACFSETLPLDRRIGLRPSALLRTYGLLVSNRSFVGFALINGLNFACVFSFISLSPLILIERMGIERSAYSLMFAMIAAGTVVGATLSFWLNRRRVALHCVISSGLVLTGTSSLIACALQWAGYGSRPFSLLPEVFVALLGVGLISPSITVEALSDVPQLAGSGSGALRLILMIFGSGVSALLASYCASHFH